MCKICERDQYSNPFYTLGKVEIDMGRFGKAYSTLEMYVPDEEICGKNADYELCYNVELPLDDGEFKSIVINYCPFCGRKLKESE